MEQTQQACLTGYFSHHHHLLYVMFTSRYSRCVCMCVCVCVALFLCARRGQRVKPFPQRGEVGVYGIGRRAIHAGTNELRVTRGQMLLSSSSSSGRVKERGFDPRRARGTGGEGGGDFSGRAFV